MSILAGPLRVPLASRIAWLPLSARHRLCIRHNSTSEQQVENTNVSHSRFLAEASPRASWKERAGKDMKESADGEEEFDRLAPGKGKLSPTSSHLFKLILPLGHLAAQRAGNPDASTPRPPTVFLLHPSQPLSHVARLIAASLAPAAPAIAFRTTADAQEAQWSDATDVADFVRDAAQTNEFTIHISGATLAAEHRSREAESGAQQGEDRSAPKPQSETETVITVEVPTFADRTRFLRRRLDVVGKEMSSMEALKRQCDHEAHRGARRMAVGGLGGLVLYWGAVARLTFWDLGWDVMEPVTYLSGLSIVICGYLWFLYQGREVSYSSVLDRSISTRREALYKAHGFDIERWLDLVAEARSVRREIGRIAQDYDKDDPRTGAMEEGAESKQDGEHGEGAKDRKGDRARGSTEEGEGERLQKEGRRGEGTELTEANSKMG